MCRSIKVLRGSEPVTADEISAAALQFVRKVSGTRKPAQIDQKAFDAAIAEITRATSALLGDMTPRKASRIPKVLPGGNDLRKIRRSRELSEHPPQQS